MSSTSLSGLSLMFNWTCCDGIYLYPFTRAIMSSPQSTAPLILSCHLSTCNHQIVRPGLGKPFRSPKKKRSHPKHSAVVLCPLKISRRKYLLSRIRQLESTLQDATEDTTDLVDNGNNDYYNADPDDGGIDDNIGFRSDSPPLSNNRLRNTQPRDTQAEAQRLYRAWKAIIPSLVTPLLTYARKSAGQPATTTLEITPCASCPHQTATRILCLFWDCE
jgi:hypothetical protein